MTRQRITPKQNHGMWSPLLNNDIYQMVNTMSIETDRLERMQRLEGRIPIYDRERRQDISDAIKICERRVLRVNSKIRVLQRSAEKRFCNDDKSIKEDANAEMDKLERITGVELQHIRTAMSLLGWDYQAMGELINVFEALTGASFGLWEED